ncbi:hypothetical protein [Nonomuraea sp. NPDC049152]
MTTLTLGQPEGARTSWSAALDAFEGVGVPKADEVRARLTVG